LGPRGRGKQPRERLPLPFPVVLDRETPDVLFTNEIAAIACGEKQELFLDIRSQVQQIHDLADPGRGDAAELCEIGIAEIRAISQFSIEQNRQSHEAGDAR